MSPYTYYIGIDPGLTGAVAVLTASGELKAALPMPVCQRTANTKMVDGAALRIQLLNILHGEPALVLIELTQAMNNDGGVAGFRFGHATAMAEGVCHGLGIDVTALSPQSWKASYHLIGRDKTAATELARSLYPMATLKATDRGSSSGLADALLLARLCWKQRKKQRITI